MNVPGVPHLHKLGPKGYDADFKLQALRKVVLEGLTPKQAAEAVGYASARSIERWLSQWNSAVSLVNMKPGPKNGSIFVMTPEELDALACITEAVPDIRLDEVMQIMGDCGTHLTACQVSRGWKYIGFTLKKPTNRDPKQSVLEQFKYLSTPLPGGIFGMDRNRHIDVDEFGTQLFHCNRSQAHSLAGTWAVQTAPTKIGKKYTTIIATSMQQIICVATFDCAGITNEMFFYFITAVLLPRIAGHTWTITMDNLQQHKYLATVAAIQQAGHHLVFRPKYSPEYGPVEMVIGAVKSVLRKHKYDLEEHRLPEWIEAASMELGPFDGFWSCSGH